MKQTPTPLQTTIYASRLLQQSSILDNQYILTLIDGSMPLNSFIKSQEQFYFAVEFFPRPMASLVARIPDAKSRLDILHNLVEEHGDFDEQSFHSNTFVAFLHSIGWMSLNQAKCDYHPANCGQHNAHCENHPAKSIQHPAVRAFNSALGSACALEDLEFGIATMGIIEYAFAQLSALIGEAVIDRGWVGQYDLVHYSQHAKIDSRHAEEFFNVLESHWLDFEKRKNVESGMEFGLYIFDRLYSELYKLATASEFRSACPQKQLQQI